MKNPLVFLSFIAVLLLSSCADSAWMAERQAAKNAGGRTFTTFVLNNRQGMHDNLKYWDEAADLKQAYPHATSSEKRILQARYNQVQRDWKAADARDAQQSAYWASVRAANAPSSSSYRPSTSSSSSYDAVQERIKQQQFNDHVRRTQSGQPHLRSNPYTNY